MVIAQNYCRKIFFACLLGISIFFVSAVCFAADSMEKTMNTSFLLTETNTIADMIHHPALAEFGEHLLPRPAG